MRGEPQHEPTLEANSSLDGPVAQRTEKSDPSPNERYEIAHPAVPEALDVVTVLHLSDLHITRNRFGGRLDEALLGVLESTPVDLIALTGDYMSRPGDEPMAMEALWQMARAWRARLGAFGVFGNHDTAKFRRVAQERLKAVRWLEGGAGVGGSPLRILGSSDPEDLLGASLAEDGTSPFTVTLVHQPSAVYAASSLGLPLVLAGHTHGGQVRLSKKKLLHTAGDLPGDRASGILRLGSTLCCVSRGLGEMLLPVRINCPRQAPLYTLRRGELSGGGQGLQRVLAW